MKKILVVILGVQVAFILFIVCLTFYRFLWDITDWNSLRIWISITYFLVAGVLCWIYRKKRFFANTLLIVSIVIIGACFYESGSPRKNTFSYEWSTQKDTLRIPFTVGQFGHLYIEATVNDTTGLFLFDTGSSLCIVNEALVQHSEETSEEHTLTDAQGISQIKKQIIIDSFRVSNIVCKEVPFWPADSATWSYKGAFEGQKEVLGIIGNTFLTNFVWDFDMENHTLTLARSISAVKETKGETVLPLQRIDNYWKLPVSINGEEKLVLLDFGHATPLQVEGMVADDKKTIYVIGENIPGSAFMHTLTDSAQSDSIFYFLAENVSLGDQSFDSIFCYEKAYTSLMGIPFIWAFERVVLDYADEKIYLMKKQAEPGKFDVRTISHQFQQSTEVENIKAGPKGYFDMHTKYYADYMAPIPTENQDAVMGKFRIYGLARYWGRNLHDVDSIQCMDSVLLPNGKIQYAPFTIEMRNSSSY